MHYLLSSNCAARLALEQRVDELGDERTGTAPPFKVYIEVCAHTYAYICTHMPVLAHT